MFYSTLVAIDADFAGAMGAICEDTEKKQYVAATHP